MAHSIPGIQLEDQPEEFLIPAVLWGEARGESTLGKLAVLWVIKNRATKRGSTMKAEILRPYQFSSFNPGDPNRGKLLAAPTADPRGWSVCEAVADLLEVSYDVTHKSTHYYVFDMPNPPKWGRGSSTWQEKAVIGAHVFGLADG